MFRLIDYEPSKNDDYNDMPVEHVVSFEYLISIIVLYCLLAAFCQLLLNEYCIVLYRQTGRPLGWSDKIDFSPIFSKIYH